jgi:ATP-binding cassette, subfamily B, bacterial
MDQDARERIPAPESWRDYLRLAWETTDVLRWAWEVMPPDSRRRTRALLAAEVLSTFAFLLLPRLLADIIPMVRESGLRVAAGIGALGACLIFRQMVKFWHQTNREWILGLNWGALDDRITREFFGKSVGQHIQESSRLAVSNIDKGRWRLLEMQGMLFFEGISALVELVLSYVLLWTLSPAAGGGMTAVISLYLAWTLYLNRKVYEVCTPIEADFRALNRYRVERWEKAERVKISCREEHERQFTNEWYDRVIGRDRDFWLWFTKQNFFRSLGGIVGFALVMLYGVFQVRSGAWHEALLLPLFIWSLQVVENIWRVGHIEHQLNWNGPSVRSMIEALNIPPDVVSGPTVLPPDEPVSLEFRNVSHSYRPEQGGDPVPVLANVSFRFGPGEKVALLGGSGAGKTTLMRLALRFMDPAEGGVFVCGCDLRGVDLPSWLGRVGYIPQKDLIFDGTLRDNLLYGLPPEERARVTDAEIWAVMDLLKVNFGKRLTHGLETKVGRHGLQLSGGQAQRLMIGAAVLKRPTFMVVDEATSSLDSTTEKEVRAGLRAVMDQGVGALIVAHRLSTVRHCDRFVVLRAADTLPEAVPQIEAEAGSFEELYSVSLTFRRLADDQEVQIGRTMIGFGSANLVG